MDNPSHPSGDGNWPLMLLLGMELYLDTLDARRFGPCKMGLH